MGGPFWGVDGQLGCQRDSNCVWFVLTATRLLPKNLLSWMKLFGRCYPSSRTEPDATERVAIEEDDHQSRKPKTASTRSSLVDVLPFGEKKDSGEKDTGVPLGPMLLHSPQSRIVGIKLSSTASIRHLSHNGPYVRLITTEFDRT
jgi:hypothetical protein